MLLLKQFRLVIEYIIKFGLTGYFSEVLFCVILLSLDRKQPFIHQYSLLSTQDYPIRWVTKNFLYSDWVWSHQVRINRSLQYCMKCYDCQKLAIKYTLHIENKNHIYVLFSTLNISIFYY